jgi:acetyl-CoA C-acetyltransferase
MSSNIVIASVARTPIAKFCGSFASLTAPELGSIAIKGALSKLPSDLIIREAYLGNVVSAGIGQAPARQAVLGAGLPESTICTTINKVCASGMKSVMLAAQTLQCSPGTGAAAMLAGGMESMSNVPHYLPKSRSGTTLGHATLLDGVIHDGLWDIYNNQHMGMCAEKCAADYGFSREDQDAYAQESYRRAQEAVTSGVFEEVVEVSIPQRRGDPVVVSQDEEPHAVDFSKMPTLRPAFDKNGTVTAANASSLNDGAVALILMTEKAALDMEIKPLARILGYGDAARSPVDFTTAPSLAVPVALKHAGVSLVDVDYHEINEAFAVVALANMKLLNLDPSTVNVFGGAVALGHPIGMSGARIIGTLYDVLKQKDATIGCASICNGGGGASAIVIERMN